VYGLSGSGMSAAFDVFLSHAWADGDPPHRIARALRKVGLRVWFDWRRGGHLKSTRTEASAKLWPMHASLKQALLEWRSQTLYNQPTDFVFSFERLKGSKPLDLALG